MNGEETLEAIRSDPSTAKIPVIILTALNDKQSVGKLIAKGISDYLLKPLDFDYAYDRIYRVLSNVKKHKSTTIRRAKILSEKDGKIKILMVERDNNFRSFFSTLFNDRFDILEAASGMEGLSKYIEQHPHYVILGERLNLLNEKLLSQKIRSLDTGNETNIYLCADNPKPSSADTFFFDGVIKKSFVPENILKEFNKTIIGQDDIFDSLNDIVSINMPTQLSNAVKQTFGVMTNQEVYSITRTDLNFPDNVCSAKSILKNKDLRIYTQIQMFCSENDLISSAKKIRNTYVSLEEGGKESCIDLFNTITGRIRSALEEKGINLKEYEPAEFKITLANEISSYLIELPFRTESGEKYLIGINTFKD